MKRTLVVVTAILCLMGCAAGFAEQSSAEVVDSNSFLLRIWNESGLEFSYLRFDMYLNENQYAGLVCSSPNEGEDFYRFPYDAENPEELDNLRVDVSYGISDLSPEDAILQVMMGNPAEEHPLLALDFIPECGTVYDLKLVPDEEGWALVPMV